MSNLVENKAEGVEQCGLLGFVDSVEQKFNI